MNAKPTKQTRQACCYGIAYLSLWFGLFGWIVWVLMEAAR